MILVRDPGLDLGLVPVGRVGFKVLDVEFAFERIRSVLARESESDTGWRFGPLLQGVYVEEHSESVVLLVRHLNRTAGDQPGVTSGVAGAQRTHDCGKWRGVDGC